jgi:hypothetical protein
MGEVVLNLLGALDVDEVEEEAGEEVDLLIQLPFTLFVIFLNLEPHVPANASNVLLPDHGIVHFAQRLGLGFQPDIEQNGILGREVVKIKSCLKRHILTISHRVVVFLHFPVRELFAKTVEKPVV